MKTWLLVGTALAAAWLWFAPARPAAVAEPVPADPSALSIEYRPGAYMPPGFPLQGRVRLLTSPVVRAG